MSMLEKYSKFVKENHEFHDRRAREFERSSPTRSKRHRDTADTLGQLLADLASIDNQLLEAKSPDSTPSPAVKKSRLSLTEEEIVGLPHELIQELNLSAGDRAEFAILSLLEEADGPLTLDKLLIGLYRRTTEIHKREKLTARLYRMAQKNLVYAFPGKKGIYALEPPAGSDSHSVEHEMQ
jgi:hypothetical protein